jgi:hypothetical protein
MTSLTGPGEGPGFGYAGQPLHILAGHGGQHRPVSPRPPRPAPAR